MPMYILALPSTPACPGRPSSAARSTRASPSPVQGATRRSPHVPCSAPPASASSLRTRTSAGRRCSTTSTTKARAGRPPTDPCSIASSTLSPRNRLRRRASARSPHAQRPRLGAHPARVPGPRRHDQRRPGRSPRHQRRDHAAASQHARDLRGVRARHDRRAPSRRACSSPRTRASRRWPAAARLCRRSRDEAARRRSGGSRDRAPEVRGCGGRRAPGCDRRARERGGHRRQERKDRSLGCEGRSPNPSQSDVRGSPRRRNAGRPCRRRLALAVRPRGRDDRSAPHATADASIVRAETDSNWSTIFSFYDRLHGTLRLNVPQDAIAIGVPAHRRSDEVTPWNSLSLSFRRAPHRWTGTERGPSELGKTTLAP